MLLTPGTRLGTYEIIAALGAGGMGEVYRAKDLRLGREIALKMLPAGVSDHPERLARFEREARMVAGINHPNIVTLYSVEEEEGVPFLTMELVEGASLDKHVVAGGLPVLRVAEIGIALADALVAAHEKSVVHRDLKPGNVMITRDGRVKVLDFGLAKLEAADSGPEVTQAATVASPLSADGQVMGTAPYMAPEQVRGEPTDSRTDLFALGIVLYELASGHRPFAGATTGLISSAILRDRPAPLAKLRAELPADLARVIERCLEKEPASRPQSALEVGNELRSVRQDLASGGARRAPAAPAVSIAVLPFVNRSRDEEDEYFSDGLADELLNMLAKIRGLRVAARTSSFHFKGKSPTIAEVGAALNVMSVLEGSVRKSGNRVRISVQLVKVEDGYHLWSETYDRTLDDVFAVQDDIAQSVVKELRTTLLGAESDSKASGEVRAEVAQAARGRGHDAEAHRLFLQARHMIDRNGREDVAMGIAYLRQAVERDPGYALAWAELGFALELNVNFTGDLQGLEASREAIQHSLELEPDLAEGHALIAYMEIYYGWNWALAERSVRRALELAPGNPFSLRMANLLARVLGRFDEAIQISHRSLEVDPLSATSYGYLGLTLDYAGRYPEAEAMYRKALELSPRRFSTHCNLAINLAVQGRVDDAAREVALESYEPFQLMARAIVAHLAGDAPASDAAKAELIEKGSAHSAYQIAQTCAMRGENNAAFEWLETAYSQRDAGVAETMADIRFRTLHDDPRWSKFLAKLGLQD